MIEAAESMRYFAIAAERVPPPCRMFQLSMVIILGDESKNNTNLIRIFYRIDKMKITAIISEDLIAEVHRLGKGEGWPTAILSEGLAQGSEQRRLSERCDGPCKVRL